MTKWHPWLPNEIQLYCSPIMKYVCLLHLSITLSLVRRIYHEGPHFSVSRGLPHPLVQTQLFLNVSNSLSMLSYLVKHQWNMWRLPRQNQWHSSISPQAQSLPLMIKLRSHHIRAEGSVLRSCSGGKKINNFPPTRCIKKISSFLSVFCLGMSRGVLWAQQWPQDREALEESAKTHSGSSQAKTPVRWLFVAFFVFM